MNLTMGRARFMEWDITAAVQNKIANVKTKINKITFYIVYMYAERKSVAAKRDLARYAIIKMYA